jgi:hypothetical protein
VLGFCFGAMLFGLVGFILQAIFLSKSSVYYSDDIDYAKLIKECKHDTED